METTETNPDIAEALALMAPGAVEANTNGDANLSEAAAIYADYERVLQGFRDSVTAAINTGKRLLRQKEKVGHGKWMEWREQYCPKISQRTVEKLMLAAEYHNKHGAVNAATIRQLYIETGSVKEDASESNATIKGEPSLLDPATNLWKKFKSAYSDAFFVDLDPILAQQFVGWIKDARTELNAMEAKAMKRMAGKVA